MSLSHKYLPHNFLISVYLKSLLNDQILSDLLIYLRNISSTYPESDILFYILLIHDYLQDYSKPFHFLNQIFVYKHLTLILTHKLLYHIFYNMLYVLYHSRNIHLHMLSESNLHEPMQFFLNFYSKMMLLILLQILLQTQFQRRIHSSHIFYKFLHNLLCKSSYNPLCTSSLQLDLLIFRILEALK